MSNIYILFINAGSGHKTTAWAIKNYLEQRYPWHCHLVDVYQEILSELDVLKKTCNQSVVAIYNHFVLQKHHPLLWNGIALLTMLNIFLRRHRSRKMMLQFWQSRKPDLVISVMPLVNQQFIASLAAYDPALPFITVLTDFAECLPGVWLTKSKHHVICGSNKAVKQAIKRGYHPNNIIATKGMIIAERFYLAKQRGSNLILRAKLQLNPKLKTGIVIFGGYGSSEMLKVAQALATVTKPSYQLIFVCGYNHAIAEKIRNLKTNYYKVVLDFIDNLDEYLMIADFLLTKFV